MSNEALLHIQALHIAFEQDGIIQQAVNGIDLQIRAGETVALVGESGSGKSVTALSLVQLLPKASVRYPQGRIDFIPKNGKAINLLEQPEAVLQHIRGKEIACIFQEPMSALNPLMTCGKQVMEILLQHEALTPEAARKKTIQLFEEVKLPQPETMVERYPHELSGGQKQRVMIAMAIACEPRLLIADEPTTALDVGMQQVIIDLLRELQAKYKMAILFISHDLQVVAQLAQRIAVMYRGDILEQGETKTILENPQHPYTQGLLACRPNKSIRVERLATVADYMQAENPNTIETKVISNSAFQSRLQQLQEQETLLSIKDLCIDYGKPSGLFGQSKPQFRAVNEVSFSIPRGSTLGLLGESGSGKTSIGKAIVGLNAISSGDIVYQGKSKHHLRGNDLQAYRRQVQLIFQDPYAALNPRMRIGDAIEEPMIVHRLYPPHERKQRVNELLLKVGLLPEHARRYPHEFSGGQRQRITIARALALKPTLLVCDESVSALDVSVQAQVLNLLKDLQQSENLTYLFISHDIAVVKHISDYIAVMQDGKLIEFNDAERLFREPKETFTKQLLGV
jgi:peptide/nickel transport system ATP-binding protein